MKKICIILLAFVLIVSMAACGTQESGSGGQQNTGDSFCV